MKNDRGKIVFVLLLIFFFLLGFVFFTTHLQYIKYKESVNSYVYGLVKLLQEKYPHVEESEIITLLNQTKPGKYNDIFLKYGIHEKDAVLYQMEQNYKQSLSMNIVFLVLIILVFTIFFFWYFIRKERKIHEITNYIQEINHKNYELKIKDNEEGELSLLRNEVYKTTILLREESENLKKEKMALKDSISDISHQLKTPLTSILIMLDNILDNPNMEENTKQDFIQNAYHQVEKINFLIVSLLKLMRIETGIVEFKKEKIKMDFFIQEVLQNIEVLRNLKNIKIEYQKNKKISFQGDFKWEVEAITNILKNAIEYSLENSPILIETYENSLYTKILIQDQGKGMSKKELQNIFKRFYKGENSASDSIGIGLNLAKNIIEKDNGFIKVESKENVGTTFEICYMK